MPFINLPSLPCLLGLTYNPASRVALDAIQPYEQGVARRVIPLATSERGKLNRSMTNRSFVCGQMLPIEDL